MNYTLELSESGDETLRLAIVTPLIAYNESQVSLPGYRPLAVAVKNSDGVVTGGLWGGTGWGWLLVQLLVVPEALRGQGLGRQLMQRAEQEALRRGCHAAWLDTFEFQARGFYERLGYTCFGTLADCPPGYSRFFMQKSLRTLT